MGVVYVVALVIGWILSAAVASAVAPQGRGVEFFVLTLLFLGPVGVGFAAVAVPREIEMAGRTRTVCPRCAATQYIGTSVGEFECWRCDQHLVVDDHG
jgi:hypothetical protein